MSTRSHEPYLQNLGFKQIPSSQRFSCSGTTYGVKGSEASGFYWIYDHEHLTISICDLTYFSDRIITTKPSADTFLSFTYFKSASGESFYPYLSVESDQTFIWIQDRQQPFCFIVHKNVPLLSVSIEYKRAFWEKHILDQYTLPNKHILSTINDDPHIPGVNHLANEILLYQKSPDKQSDDDDFFEQKSREILDFIFKYYFNQKRLKKRISDEDYVRLLAVKSYIDDHYAGAVPLELLSQIAWMGKSSLKTKFKQAFQMTITEYIQRRRMIVADHLLMAGDMKIGEVARAVGYQSASRFSALYKRHKGISPLEYRIQLRRSAPDTDID